MLSLTTTVPVPNCEYRMPQMGFGVWDSPKDIAAKSVHKALDIGYRHVDTAQYYQNEAEVGEGVRASGVPRAEVYLTTKIHTSRGSVEKSYDSCVKSVEKMDPGDKGYADLFLVHSSSGGKSTRKELWQALEKLHKEGKSRAIGVSNWGIGHIEQMKEYAEVWPPMVNQLELHPWCQQREIVKYCQEKGIVVQAYCPIVRNRKAHEETVVRIAEKVGCTTQQVLLRYCLQKDWVPLPKSDNPERIKQNADVYDFELQAEDMKALDDVRGDKGDTPLVQAVDNDDLV